MNEESISKKEDVQKRKAGRPVTKKEIPLKFKDIKELKCRDYKAVFKTETGYDSSVPQYHGILVDNGKEVPCLFMTTIDGTIMPVFMIQGFSGIYPKETKLPEPESNQEQKPLVEPQAEIKEAAEEPVALIQEPAEIATETVPIIEQAVSEPAVSQPTPTIEPVIPLTTETPTKNILSRIFHSKNA